MIQVVLTNTVQDTGGKDVLYDTNPMTLREALLTTLQPPTPYRDESPPYGTYLTMEQADARRDLVQVILKKGDTAELRKTDIDLLTVLLPKRFPATIASEIGILLQGKKTKE